MNRTLSAVILAGASGAFSGVGLADDSAALGGPKVVEAAAPAAKSDAMSPAGEAMQARPTIVQRNFSGDVELIEDQRVEVAAVRAMTLDEATRAKVDALLAERAAAVTTTTLDNYELFIKLQGAFQAGAPTGTPEERRAQRRQTRELMQQMAEAVAPLTKPTLLDRLAGVLSTEEAATLRAMVQEYNEATKDVREARRKAATGEGEGEGMTARGGPQAARREAVMQHVEELRAMMREMARSFGAFVAERQERMETLLVEVSATPEQRSKIDAIVRRGGDGEALRLTEENRSRIIREVYAVLDTEQRKRFVEAMRERATGEK
jgi:hypothetical protein